MKCIYPDNILSISATEENSNYPVSNLLDEHPKKVWKGTSRDATVEAVVSGGSALAIIYTNAVSINLILSSGQTINWDSGIDWMGGVAWDQSGNNDYSETKLLTGNTDGCAWFDFAERNSSFSVIIELTAEAGEIIQAGILRCGICNSFENPSYGLREKLKDYSIVKELNNGAIYVRKKEVVRVFSGRILEDRDSDFYTFLLKVARNVGPQPLAWLVVSNGGSRWIIYGGFSANMPEGHHDQPAHSWINFHLVEVV